MFNYSNCSIFHAKCSDWNFWRKGKNFIKIFEAIKNCPDSLNLTLTSRITQSSSKLEGDFFNEWVDFWGWHVQQCFLSRQDLQLCPRKYSKIPSRLEVRFSKIADFSYFGGWWGASPWTGESFICINRHHLNPTNEPRWNFAKIFLKHPYVYWWEDPVYE